MPELFSSILCPTKTLSSRVLWFLLAPNEDTR